MERSIIYEANARLNLNYIYTLVQKCTNTPKGDFYEAEYGQHPV